jgi:hypothetical protein
MDREADIVKRVAVRLAITGEAKLRHRQRQYGRVTEGVGSDDFAAAGKDQTNRSPGAFIA